MVMIKNFTVSVILVMLTSIIFWQTDQAVKDASSENILERPVPGVNPDFLTTPEAFSASLGFTRVPGGMVKIQSCDGKQEKRLWQPRGLILRKVLNSIILEDPQYVWVHEEGVINLLPVSGEPPLLRTRITELRVENVTSANEALGHLLALPELKKGMADLDLKYGLWLFAEPQPLRPRSFNVHCREVTLREALNAIARAEGSEVWDYVEIHCDGKNEVVIRF